MPAYVRLQQREFELEALGYTATRHQTEVGTGYFDRIATIVSGGDASTLGGVPRRKRSSRRRTLTGAASRDGLGADGRFDVRRRAGRRFGTRLRRLGLGGRFGLRERLRRCR